MQSQIAGRPGNRLLASLPAEEWALVQPHVQETSLVFHEVLAQPGDTIRQVWFPNAGAISCLTALSEGGTIEAMLIGTEGVAGSAVAHGVPRSPWRMVVQAGGDAVTIAPSALDTVLTQTPELQRLLFRYGHVMQQLAAQTIACNRFHPVVERLARWLLMVLDRTEGTRLQVTHEFLGQMLGTHRPTVTIALGALSRAGLIEPAHRAQVIILDRTGLEDAACECYGVIDRALHEIYE